MPNVLSSLSVHIPKSNLVHFVYIKFKIVFALLYIFQNFGMWRGGHSVLSVWSHHLWLWTVMWWKRDALPQMIHGWKCGLWDSLRESEHEKADEVWCLRVEIGHSWQLQIAIPLNAFDTFTFEYSSLNTLLNILRVAIGPDWHLQIGIGQPLMHEDYRGGRAEQIVWIPWNTFGYFRIPPIRIYVRMRGALA